MHPSTEALVHAFDVLGSGVAAKATAGAFFPWALVPAIPYAVVIYDTSLFVRMHGYQL